MVDIITPNETESKKSSPVLVLKMMKMQRRRRRYCMKIIRTVLITLGSRGVWASVNGEGGARSWIPGCRLSVPLLPEIPLTAR
ncbi:hypothetical protein ACLK1S_23255 [Escherichia coli]